MEWKLVSVLSANMNMLKFGNNLVSLFAGCGGSSLGYKAAGFSIRLAVEWDIKAAACYQLNFPETPIYKGDIRELDEKTALELAGMQLGELDILDGSPPCQGFSTAGKRRLDDKRNNLFGEYVRLLDIFRPKVFVMENVNGLRKGKMKLIFAEIHRALKAAGYFVSCRELNVWWYGVPQDRRCLIWIGIREDLGIRPSHPLPICKNPISVSEALSLDSGGIKNKAFRNHYRSIGLPSPTLITKPPYMIEIHPGYKDSYFREGPNPILTSRKPRITRERPAECYEKALLGQEIISWQSRKLDKSRASFIQIASRRNWHPKEARYITIEEAKILQGFPISFQVSEYRLIGNSVPPPLTEAIGGHVKQLFDYYAEG